MAQDSSSRKWQITINNPADKGFTHDQIISKVGEFKQIQYWCMADEIGENGTYHTHVYIHSKSVVRFSSVKKRFDGAHFEMAKGTSLQNMEYISKTGKWENDKKHETCVVGSFEEFGELPMERQGKRNDIDDLYAMIKEGMSNYQILEECPQYMLNIDKVERARQIVMEEKFKDSWRNIDVTYIYGITGAGKTRGVMERYGYSNVYRVTDYQHPFDGYKGQDVVIFEEFRSSLKINDMLNNLDGYPLDLPCRYANKQACYTKVYLITNIPLSQQYGVVQEESPETFRALLRRINHVIHYARDGVTSELLELDGNGFTKLTKESFVPFTIPETEKQFEMENLV